LEVVVAMVADSQAAEWCPARRGLIWKSEGNDVRLALVDARAADVPLPNSSLLHDHAMEGIANGREIWDWSSPARVAAIDAG
jgi:hypothetical protein